MIPVAEARQRIVAAFAPLPSVVVSLDEALGRVLAEDVAARLTQPPAAVSAMDGYAVRAADVQNVPATLTQIGAVPAGALFGGTVGPGQCVRIFTGAPLPPGADAIVIQEDTSASGDTITVKEGASAGRYVRAAGLDFKQGDVGLKAGRILRARDIGFAAAMNHPWLKVRRKPRIAILASGDEVVLPGDPVGPSQIVSSNGPALAAFVTACGGEPVSLGIAKDSTAALQQAAEGARGADLLVTTGGASVGEHDLVRSALGERGLVLDFWQIAMRPGKPLIFGRINDTPLLGLPGNPVSSLVCSLVFLKPAMERMLGLAPDGNQPATARLGRDMPANDKREDYLRATLTTDAAGQLVATPFDRQDSSMLSLMVRADCLAIRPANAPAAKAGEPISIVPLRGLTAPI
jgi:molybdopterin molybdotransferase